MKGGRDQGGGGGVYIHLLYILYAASFLSGFVSPTCLSVATGIVTSQPQIRILKYFAWSTCACLESELRTKHETDKSLQRKFSEKASGVWSSCSQGSSV